VCPRFGKIISPAESASGPLALIPKLPADKAAVGCLPVPMFCRVLAFRQAARVAFNREHWTRRPRADGETCHGSTHGTKEFHSITICDKFCDESTTKLI
jgi:hypothetical protein